MPQYSVNPTDTFLNDLYIDKNNKVVRNIFKKRHIEVLKNVVEMMINGDFITLRKPPYRAHKLKGKRKNKEEWDLHISGDIVLIYRINKSMTIDLVRIGTHNQIFNG